MSDHKALGISPFGPATFAKSALTTPDAD